VTEERQIAREAAHNAYMRGFRDGYQGRWDEPVTEEHLHYERGFIFGCGERREREKQK